MFGHDAIKELIKFEEKIIKEVNSLSSSLSISSFSYSNLATTSSFILSVAACEHQIIDGLSPEDQKRFMLHYNFPQFSVGETGRYGAPGRREVGHGAFASWFFNLFSYSF